MTFLMAFFFAVAGKEVWEAVCFEKMDRLEVKNLLPLSLQQLEE